MTEEITTNFTSDEFTTIVSVCKNCGNTIIEAIRKRFLESHHNRVECCHCLARWWAFQSRMEKQCNNGKSGVSH